MNSDFWLARWDRDEIGFHQPGGHPMLGAHWPASTLAANARVLVPLCGKSADMTWLAARGHAVTGVELSRRAAQDYFAERGLAPATSATGGFETLAADGVEIAVGDIFALTPAELAGFEAIYDRAALIALPPAIREHYASQVLCCIAPNAQGLLITLDYDPAEMDGPPFAVADAEVRRLLGAAFEIECRAETAGLADDDHLRHRGLTDAVERVYRLRRYSS